MITIALVLVLVGVILCALAGFGVSGKPNFNVFSCGLGLVFLGVFLPLLTALTVGLLFVLIGIILIFLHCFGITGGPRLNFQALGCACVFLGGYLIPVVGPSMH